jgi:hypothetical protein
MNKRPILAAGMEKIPVRLGNTPKWEKNAHKTDEAQRIGPLVNSSSSSSLSVCITTETQLKQCRGI